MSSQSSDEGQQNPQDGLKGRPDGSSLQDWLFDEVMRSVGELKGALDLKDLKEVFSRVLRATQGEVAEEVRPSTSRPLRVVEDGDRRIFFGERPWGLVLAVEVFSAVSFQDVRSQMIQNGALFLKIPEAWPVNMEADICVVLPNVQLEIWFKGRVVHQSDAGTAFEVRPASREHETWWAIAADAFRAGRQVPRLPSAGPKTEPPGAERRTAERARPSSASSREAAPASRQKASRPRPELRTTSEMPAIRREAIGEVDPAELEGQLNEKVASLAKGTHFDVLDLPWSAFTEQIEASYFRLQHRFHLDHFPVTRRPDLRGVVRHLQEALDEAYHALRDTQSRRRYRAGFIGESENKRGAEMYLEKAEMALMMGDEKRGRRYLKHVLELDPLNSEARRLMV